MHLWKREWRIFFLLFDQRWRRHPNAKSLNVQHGFVIRLNHLRKLNVQRREISPMISMVISSHCMKKVFMPQDLSLLFAAVRLKVLDPGLSIKSGRLKEMIRLDHSSSQFIARVLQPISLPRFTSMQSLQIGQLSKNGCPHCVVQKLQSKFLSEARRSNCCRPSNAMRTTRSFNI